MDWLTPRLSGSVLSPTTRVCGDHQEGQAGLQAFQGHPCRYHEGWSWQEPPQDKGQPEQAEVQEGPYQGCHEEGSCHCQVTEASAKEERPQDCCGQEGIRRDIWDSVSLQAE